MRYLDVNLACRGNDKPFDFGYKGENIVTGVIFDYSSWRELYGVGALTLAVQPSGNSNPYPVTLTAIDDTHALWTLTKTDLNEEGAGRCQLTYAVGEAIKKSAVFVYKAGYSMDATGEIPDPYISYFEQILETGAQVQADAAAAAQSKADAETAAQDERASADEIENMTATAETLPAGSDATAEYSDGTLSLGIPQGAPGDEGPQGPPGPTGNGIQSTVLNADYTLTITFTNGSTYTTPSIRGPQGPDGETGPTGNGIQSTVLNSDYTLTITFTDGTTYTTPSIRGEQGEQGDPGVVQDVTVNGTSVLDGTVAKVVIPEITKTVTGNPIVIDDADGEVKALNVELAPIQEGTGTPSPTNIRPIYPHTSLPVRDTGKNLLNLTEDGMISQGWNRAFAMTMSAGTYTLSCQNRFGANDTKYGQMMQFNDADNNLVKRFAPNYQFGDTVMSLTITLTEEEASRVAYLLFQPQANYMPFSQIENGKLQLEYGSTATSYAPYTGQAVTVPLNDLYGGNVDVIGGTSSENMGYADLGSLSWRYRDGLFSASIPNFAPPSEYLDRKTGFITSIYPADTQISISSAAMTDKTALRGAGDIYIKDTSYTDITAFTNSVTGQDICFELATPTPLTTTPTALTLYEGDNVVSSDGDITLNYERNLQTVITSIEDRLSALES